MTGKEIAEKWWSESRHGEGFSCLALAADIDAAIAEAVRAEREEGFEAFVFAIETMLLQAPELNMSNYNDDDVAALNSATISAYLYVKERADAIRAQAALNQP